MSSRQCSLAAGAVLLCLGMGAAAQLPEDPWALLPAPPTSCYQNQDSFSTAITDALATLQEAYDAQESTNSDIDNEAHENLSSTLEADPFALARKLQEMNAKDPQAALRMVQQSVSVGAAQNEAANKEAKEAPERDAAFDKLIQGYRAAHEEANAPIQARIEALQQSVCKEEGPTFKQKATAGVLALNQPATAAYEQVCAKWFGPQGAFRPWLTDYRNFLVKERVPQGDQLAEERKRQLGFQGTDAGEYRSTAAVKAAIDYGQRLQQIYAERLEEPIDMEALYIGKPGAHTIGLCPL